ncbi:hypothetical protein E2986_06121 [Frieseomelitta varia]|uniref:SMC hinge domain-containing protein n=1 Tax=Frieseomelitta varia TaxID=561572 RepID=A0A833RN38_9HYME|nr:hypothetical protein E2986_06121 [Frieseomelitta varia]
MNLQFDLFYRTINSFTKRINSEYFFTFQFSINKVGILYCIKIKMQVQLDRIIIFNFKSFKGEVTVGPIKPFTAIIGANGSGKSNIMDAISFVMGEKAKSLRVKQLNELIYGTFRGIPIGHRAYVTAVFVFEDSSVETFTRTIYHTSSEYKINDQVVAAQLYMSKLRKLNLNVTTKNFLVFQGAIDSTLMKTPKEYTHMFEEISNSIELKEEYESKKTELYLFELFHIQKDIEDLHVTLKATELKLIKYKTDKDNESDVLKERKRQLKIALETLENIEQDLFNLENGVKMKQTNLLEAKEKVSYCEQKFNSISRKLSEARELNKSHLKAIKELMQRKDELMQMKSKLEEDIATHLLSQGSSIQFNDIQVEEYFHLKQTAGAQCSENIQVSISLKREQSVNQNKLDNENRKKYELEATLQQKSILKGETERRIKRLQQCMDENQDMLTNKINTKYNLENMIVKEKKDVESIQQELQCLSEQLDSAKLDKFTTSRLIKGEETIKILQNLFTGVYDRLYKLCKPIHPKYDVAMTKVLGKYCNSIIVSTNKVAVQCINYLKEQKIGTETFLPVESLKVEPIKKNLRGITNPKNVKLLYDVLNFEHREINNVILFVTKNTLVCETSEDAIILADEMEPTKINSTIHMYNKSTIHMYVLIYLIVLHRIVTSIMLMEELRKKMKISQNESEIITLDNNITLIKNDMMKTAHDIQNIEKSMMNIEDTVFKKFCEKVNISNIRQYEEGYLKYHQEQTKKKLELEEQYSRIKNLLKFEKDRDTKSIILKMEKDLNTVKNELEQARQNEVLCTESTEYETNKLNNLRSKCNEAKINVNEQTKNVNECRYNIGIIAKSIINTEKELIVITTNIKKKKVKYHAILKNCKMENVTIPLLSGCNVNNFEDVQILSTSDSTPNTDMQDMFIPIDFKILSEDIRTRTDERVINLKSKLMEEVEKLQNEMQSVKNPNFKEAREKMNAIKKQFETVKQERYNRFTRSLEYVATELDSIYKCLVKSQSAQATLIPDNPEEPYLAGLNYSCVMPGKRYQSFSNLSGGEKTLATLAILFAIHRPAPFCVLDEIDAALDTINIKNVVQFICSKKEEMQFIIVSLNQQLYSHADALIGVCSDTTGECPESLIYTLSLKEYSTSYEK